MSNVSKVLLCDLDNTLTDTISGKTFKQHPQDVKLLPGAQQAIASYAKLGYKIFGVSNQGGCSTLDKNTGKPLKTVEDAIAEMQYTLLLFPELSIISFCPDMDGNRCFLVCRNTLRESDTWKGLYRKPYPGMPYEIEHIVGGFHAVDRTLSLFVGDRPEDAECAKRSGYFFESADDWRSRFLK